jgi:hypothetical protein
MPGQRAAAELATMRAMRRSRLVPAALAALVLAAASLLVLSGGSSAKPSKSQTLFRTTLLEDAKTTPGVKRALRDGGIVAPEIQFQDVTGDGRSDAVVTVETGGAAGAVAVYVFSTHGKAADSPLRAVYRSQQLYRASIQVSAGTLILRTPRWASGDDLCCPAKVFERVYAWNDAASTLKQRSSQELAGPGAATATPAVPPAQG